MSFIMRDYHTDRDRGVYITGAGRSRSTFTTDTFRHAFEVLQDRKYVNHIDNVAASESINNQLLRDIWESSMWNWYSDEDKEINAASNSELRDFLFEGVA